MNEQKKYKVIKALKETNGNKKRAAVELGCSVRHINRMLKGYNEHGKAFFSHGNKGRRPASALSEELKESILLLYQNKYYDSNLTHFTEKLAENEGIRVSEGTVRNLLLSHDILSPLAWKRTRRNLKDKLKAQKDASTSKKEKERLQTAIVALEDAHPTRSRCSYAGEMIQMDVALHFWFGESKTYLHAAIDDATGTLVGAFFSVYLKLYSRACPSNYGWQA